MPAFTFDNVNGKFPTGFKIWDTNNKELFSEIRSDIFDKDNIFLGEKTFKSFTKKQLINNWISEYRKLDENAIGYMDGINANDFQNYNKVYIVNTKEQIGNPRGIFITKDNLFEISIYFAIRHIIEHTWIIHNDQFLYPNNEYKKDTIFRNDCLMFTLFYGKNSIQSKYGVNHWIPFTEEEVNARSNFESHFMTSFTGGNIIQNGYSDLFFTIEEKNKPLKFSKEAKVAFRAGKKLWQYYHAQPSANVNASLYDIREFFQGRDASGKMNAKSGDDTYNALIRDLRSALKTLAAKIQPKVYEYGFLVE